MATESNKKQKIGQSNQEVFSGGLINYLKEHCQFDVLLKAGESDNECAPISAHKLLLAGRSEVFKNLLESDKFKAPLKIETITLSDMKHEEVEALVEFIYTVDGSIPYETLMKHVRSLYIAADKYEIPHLRDVCRSHLISSSLRSLNPVKILELAQIPFDKALHDVAFAVIRASITKISNSDEFKDFFVNHPHLIGELMKENHCGTCGRHCSYCKTGVNRQHIK